jgi:hypothetical protein
MTKTGQKQFDMTIMDGMLDAIREKFLGQYAEYCGLLFSSGKSVPCKDKDSYKFYSAGIVSRIWVVTKNQNPSFNPKTAERKRIRRIDLRIGFDVCEHFWPLRKIEFDKRVVTIRIEKDDCTLKEFILYVKESIRYNRLCHNFIHYERLCCDTPGRACADKGRFYDTVRLLNNKQKHALIGRLNREAQGLRDSIRKYEETVNDCETIASFLSISAYK